MTNSIRIGQIENRKVCVVRRNFDKVPFPLCSKPGNGVKLMQKVCERIAFSRKLGKSKAQHTIYVEAGIAGPRLGNPERKLLLIDLGAHCKELDLLANRPAGHREVVKTVLETAKLSKFLRNRLRTIVRVDVGFEARNVHE